MSTSSAASASFPTSLRRFLPTRASAPPRSAALELDDLRDRDRNRDRKRPVLARVVPASLAERLAAPPHPHKFHWKDWAIVALACAVLALCAVMLVQSEDNIVTDVEKMVSCAACVSILRPLAALATVGDEAMTSVFAGFCSRLGIQDPDVCTGAVSDQAPILAHALRSLNLDSPGATSLCVTVFGLCPVQEVGNWTVPLPERGEKALEAEERKIGNSSGVETFQVVHLSDVHIDREYLVNSSTHCSKEICCRDYGAGTVGDDVVWKAGKYGHSVCDAPPLLFTNVMEAIERFALNRSFTIFTGDVIDSAVWDLNYSRVHDGLQLFNDDLQSGDNGTYTNSSQVVYSAYGNHDTDPVNGFPLNSTTSGADIQWVYDLLADDWKGWIGAEAAEQVRTKSGCYSVVHPGTSLKVISLNTNYWNNRNFYLYEKDDLDWDPNGIITWLASELDAAEQAGQRAWIIGHSPTGQGDTLQKQSNYLDQVFQRYASTIAAHFYGHTHSDEFRISYSDYDNRSSETATGIAYVAGAVTPRSGNPGFRVYEINAETYEVMDFTVYSANRDAWDFNDLPTWNEYYQARSAYNSLLSSPFPDDAPMNATFWHQVTEVFNRNDTAFQLYNGRLARGNYVGECTDSCKTSTMCKIRSLRTQNSCSTVTPGLHFTRRDAIPIPASAELERRLTMLQEPDEGGCEGPGLFSMMQHLGRELAVWDTAPRSRVFGRDLANEVKIPALFELQQAAEEEVARHRLLARK
ncbi:hypothetical protein JCM10207_005752 [Rhodosporidiobolus poonsookiae]